MRRTLYIIFALLLLPAGVYAQGWRSYSPPGTSYSVESPAPFRRVRYYEGEHGVGDAWTTKEEARGSVVYVARQPSSAARDYAILALDIPEGRRPLSAEVLDYLKWWIGGDDDSEPTGVTDVNVNGLKGKEYMYAKDIALDRYTRGRIFDGGDRVYILIFKSTTAADLTSGAATRFLNSFRIRKRSGNQRGGSKSRRA
jgi:hypothetical protein